MMPKVIGLTGGIGSGKSRVAEVFLSLGVPCYIADKAAKRLMVEDSKLKQAIIELFGEAAYSNHTLNRKHIGEIVFHDTSKLAALNAIVHPAVGKDFEQWLSLQNASYVIKEVAILFETGGHNFVDKSVLVTAPKALRIARVMERDNCSEAEVLARMANQWEDEKRIPLADYVLENIEWSTTQKTIQSLHQTFLTLIT